MATDRRRRDDFDPRLFPDLADRVTALAASVPVALLPVRIETRFLRRHRGADPSTGCASTPTTSTSTSTNPPLTDAEIAAAERYWAARAGADGDRLPGSTRRGRRWPQTYRHGPGRVDRPHDPAGQPTAYPASTDRPQGRPVDQGGGRAGAARNGSSPSATPAASGSSPSGAQPVADRLAVGPEPDVDADDDRRALGPPPADRPTLPLDEGMRWLVDLEEAQRVGMAITIELRPEFAGGLTVSSCWACAGPTTPTTAPQLLGDVARPPAVHRGPRRSSRPDAPTNNTADERSQLTTAPSTATAARTATRPGPDRSVPRSPSPSGSTRPAPPTSGRRRDRPPRRDARRDVAGDARLLRASNSGCRC